MSTDAEIRRRYYKRYTDSPGARRERARAAETEREREVSRGISAWNRGEDPSLRAISAGEVALSRGGFSGVDIDPAERRRVVKKAMETDLPDWLPSGSRERMQARQDAMGKRLSEREREQVEFARMAGVKPPSVNGDDPSTWVSSGTARDTREQATPKNKRLADEEMKRSGITPEEFWSESQGMSEFSEREQTTPDKGLVRQAVGPSGFVSVKYSPKDAAKLAQQRASEAQQRATEKARATTFREKVAENRAATTARVAEETAKQLGISVNELPKTRTGEVDLDRARGLVTEQKFAQWDADKRALEEGKQLQKQAGMRISRINRQLREAGRYRQKWEKASPTLSAEEYDALVQERGELQGLVGRRESLKEKGITEIGRTAEGRRRQKGEQAAALARANMARIQAAEAEANAYKTKMSMANPYITQMQSYMAPMFPFLGQGGFGVSGTSIPFTLNPDLTLPPVAAEGEKKGKKNS